jgi:hypothetical protein
MPALTVDAEGRITAANDVIEACRAVNATLKLAASGDYHWVVRVQRSRKPAMAIWLEDASPAGSVNPRNIKLTYLLNIVLCAGFFGSFTAMKDHRPCSYRA